MYETLSEYPIVPYFQWGLHLSLEKTSHFWSPYPTWLWSERFRFELHLLVQWKPMIIRGQSLLYQKPSWHICNLTPKPSWKVLPKFNEMGPKPIKKKQLKKTTVIAGRIESRSLDQKAWPRLAKETSERKRVALNTLEVQYSNPDLKRAKYSRTLGFLSHSTQATAWFFLCADSTCRARLKILKLVLEFIFGL